MTVIRRIGAERLVIVLITVLSVAAALTLLTIYQGGRSKAWAIKDVAFISKIDGTKQHSLYIRGRTDILVVELPTWSQGRKAVTQYEGMSLQDASLKNGWHYIRPEARGPNNHPDSCCSAKVIEDINQSIEYAMAHGDIHRIYLVGTSGGGYHALCYLAQGRYVPDHVSAWVPITDLALWRRQEAARRYHKEIDQCAADDMKRRSPLYNLPSARRMQSTRLDLYAGIADGHGKGGSVPIVHTLRYFNALARRSGDPGVSQADMKALTSGRYNPDAIRGGREKIYDRAILYQSRSENVRLFIFDGGHQMIVPHVVESYRGLTGL